MEAYTYLHETYGLTSDQVSPIRIGRFNRHDLIKLFAKFGYSVGAEIGVAEGKFSEVMLKIIPNLKLSSIDAWEVVRENPRSEQIGNNLAATRYEEAKERLGKFPNCQLIKSISMEAVREFKWESLDFVYIDGAHDFDYVMEDIIAWSRRVRKGGIVAGHDYYRFHHAGVIQAVDLYAYMHSIHEYFITDERTPTWFWVKR